MIHITGDMMYQTHSCSGEKGEGKNMGESEVLGGGGAGGGGATILKYIKM